MRESPAPQNLNETSSIESKIPIITDSEKISCASKASRVADNKNSWNQSKIPHINQGEKNKIAVVSQSKKMSKVPRERNWGRNAKEGVSRPGGKDFPPNAGAPDQNTEKGERVLLNTTSTSSRRKNRPFNSSTPSHSSNEINEKFGKDQSSLLLPTEKVEALKMPSLSLNGLY